MNAHTPYDTKPFPLEDFVILAKEKLLKCSLDWIARAAAEQLKQSASQTALKMAITPPEWQPQGGWSPRPFTMSSVSTVIQELQYVPSRQGHFSPIRSPAYVVTKGIMVVLFTAEMALKLHTLCWHPVVCADQSTLSGPRGISICFIESIKEGDQDSINQSCFARHVFRARFGNVTSNTASHSCQS